MYKIFFKKKSPKSVVSYSYLLEWKARKWRQNYQFDKSVPFMIESKIPATSGSSEPPPKTSSKSQRLSQKEKLFQQKVKNQTSDPIPAKKLDSDHLPKVPRLDNDFLARFIKGPWLDENQPTKSREEKKSEKKLFKRLVKTREKIADEAGLKPTLVAGDDDLTLLTVVRTGMYNLN